MSAKVSIVVRLDVEVHESIERHAPQMLYEAFKSKRPSDQLNGTKLTLEMFGIEFPARILGAVALEESDYHERQG